MLSSDEAYRPDEDIDPNSKLSYIQWISHYLGMTEPLDADDNGNMASQQLVNLTEGVLRKTHSIEKDTDIKLQDVINEIQNDLDQTIHEQTIKSLEQIKRKQIQKLTKYEHGVLISASLSFQFLGDAHIGKVNGVISKTFLQEIYESVYDHNDEDFSEEKYFRKGRLSRKGSKKMKIPELYLMFQKGESENEEESREGTMVPEFQRSDQQWKRKQWLNFVDSVLRNIPMPSIVLGKSKDQINDPWQVIDGNQRLSTIVKIYDQTHPQHIAVTKPWRRDDEVPGWILERMNDYEFNVERVVAKDDRQLAELYERYNDSGIKMTSAQIRVAKFHEISALHHLLLALAGGPVLRNRQNARKRLGINEAINIFSKNAQSLRNLLPLKSGKIIREDEKNQLRLVTEKVYDLYCSIVAYSTYQSVRGEGVENPSAKVAIEHVFNQYRRSQSNNNSQNDVDAIQHNASKIVDALDYVIKEVSTAYGDFAFLSLRMVSVKDEYDEEGKPKIEYPIGKTIHRWAAQVQCAAFWDLSDNDITLIKKNPDDFQNTWREFCIENMVNAQQNSTSIWDVQRRWKIEVSEFLTKLRQGVLSDQNSAAYKRLLAEVQRAVAMPEEGQESFISGWTEELFTKDEITFLRKTYERMKKD